MWQQCETELSTTACHTAELESQKWAAEVSRLQSGAAQAKRAVEAQQARADGALRQLQSSTAAVRDWQRRAVEAERQVSVLGTRLETLQTPQRQQSPHKNVSRNSSNSSSSSTRSSNVRRRRSTSGGHCGSDCAGGSKAAAFGTDGSGERYVSQGPTASWSGVVASSRNRATANGEGEVSLVDGLWTSGVEALAEESYDKRQHAATGTDGAVDDGHDQCVAQVESKKSTITQASVSSDIEDGLAENQVSAAVPIAKVTTTVRSKSCSQHQSASQTKKEEHKGRREQRVESLPRHDATLRGAPRKMEGGVASFEIIGGRNGQYEVRCKRGGEGKEGDEEDFWFEREELMANYSEEVLEYERKHPAVPTNNPGLLRNG